jgi:hypothetical protein
MLVVMPNQPKTPQRQFRVRDGNNPSRPLYEEVQEVAAWRGESATSVVNRALIAYVDQYKAEMEAEKAGATPSS